MKRHHPRPSSRPSPSPRRRLPNRRPSLEPLEERSLLSLTITVNTSADDPVDLSDGLMSLREAIEVSNGDIPFATVKASADAAFVTGTPSPPPTGSASRSRTSSASTSPRVGRRSP